MKNSYLERLVDPGQLLSYPSHDYPGFNRAYERARACMKTSSAVKELYVVQYRSSGDELLFSFVTQYGISPKGRVRLKDICAVIRS